MDVCEIFGVVELDSNVQQCLKSWKLYNSNKQEWIASVQSRDAKIQRFKLLKELQRKLQVCLYLIFIFILTVKDNNIGDCNDMERQKALLGLQIASIQTVENLVMIEQESQLLQMRQSAQTVQKQQPSTDQTDCVDIRPGRSILNATGPLLSREGKVCNYYHISEPD